MVAAAAVEVVFVVVAAAAVAAVTVVLVVVLAAVVVVVVAVTRDVTVSMSAFLTCHQCHCAGSSLAWGLNLRALVCGIF